MSRHSSRTTSGMTILICISSERAAYAIWWREMKFNFLKDGTVEDEARKVKAAGGHRPKEPNS